METRLTMVRLLMLIQLIVGSMAREGEEDGGGEAVVLDEYQNQLLRDTMNKVAGRELIPKEASFQLRSIVVSTSTSSTLYLEDGSKVVFKSSSYSETSSADFMEPSSFFFISIILTWIHFVQV